MTIPNFTAGEVLLASELNQALADTAATVPQTANTFTEPQTFAGTVNQTPGAGANNESPFAQYGDFLSDFIVDGLSVAVPSPASLTATLSTGTAVVLGQRTVVNSIPNATNTYAASSDTYVSLSQSGVVVYAAVANGATAPAPASDAVNILKVVTGPIVSPTPTLSAGTSGTLAAGTYQVALVAYDATGYGAVSASESVTVAASGSIGISWANPLNETSMSIYVTAEGGTTLGLVESGVTGTSYTYTGSVAPGAAAPSGATSNAVQSAPNLVPLDGISSGDGSLVGYNQGGLGAVQRTLQSRLQDSVNVLDFGAVIGGSIDCTEAFTNAGSIGSNVQVNVPPGVYLLDSDPTPSGYVTWVLQNGAEITGSGRLPHSIIHYGSPYGPMTIRSNGLSVLPAGSVGALKVGVCEGTESSWTENPAANNPVAFYPYISSSSVRSQIWAANPIVDVLSGYSATAWIMECDINLDTSNAPDPRSTNQALGIDMVSGGDYAPSCAFSTLSTTLANRWKYGMWFDNIGGQSGSTLIKTAADVSVDFGLDLSTATINYQGVRVGVTDASQTAAIGAVQLGSSPAVFLQRSSDASPNGEVLIVANNANSDILAYIDAFGNIVGEAFHCSSLNSGDTIVNGTAAISGGDIGGVSTGYAAQGLTVGWNFTGGQGEVDLLLGPQSGAGGLNIYALNSSGNMASTTPIFALTQGGSLTLGGTLNVQAGTSGNLAVNYTQMTNGSLSPTFSSLSVSNSSTLTGTTSGTITSSMPEQGVAKKFMAYADAYENDTTTAQTITFPTAFNNTPVITTNTSGLTLTVSTTELTITAPDNSTAYSGLIIVEGF